MLLELDRILVVEGSGERGDLGRVEDGLQVEVALLCELRPLGRGEAAGEEGGRVEIDHVDVVQGRVRRGDRRQGQGLGH